jgi:hypothetical protein
MRLRTILPAVMIAGALSFAGGASAYANVMWCVFDPPIQVVTPAGMNLTVNNMIYVPRSELHRAAHFPVSATAVSNGHGGTLITVHVQVASGVASAHVVSAVNRFDVSSAGGGEGGTVVTTTLDVPAA